MVDKIPFEFSAKIWRYNGPTGWFFVSLPHSITEEIRDHLKWQEEGWGRMKAHAVISGYSWDTAIWFDKKEGTYLLPIKQEVRKNISLTQGDLVDITIFI